MGASLLSFPLEAENIIPSSSSVLRFVSEVLTVVFCEVIAVVIAVYVGRSTAGGVPTEEGGCPDVSGEVASSSGTGVPTGEDRVAQRTPDGSRYVTLDKVLPYAMMFLFSIFNSPASRRK